MCLIVLCFLSLCYMCIYMFDCYSMYMLFANKEFIHLFIQYLYKTQNRTMYIQNLKQDNVYTKPKTGQCLYKT